MNKLVARFNDGSLMKGVTIDFTASRETFHVAEPAPHPGRNPREVHACDLKALFFVRDYDGDPQYTDRRNCDRPAPPGERWVEVVFNDGEHMVGTTPRYKINGPGFFLVPADPQSNNMRCFVIESSCSEVRYI